MKPMIALMLAVLSLALAACNTMEGVGRDIQTGGENLRKAAQRNK